MSTKDVAITAACTVVAALGGIYLYREGKKAYGDYKANKDMKDREARLAKVEEYNKLVDSMEAGGGKIDDAVKISLYKQIVGEAPDLAEIGLKKAA